MTAFGCKGSWVCGKGKMNWLEKIFTPKQIRVLLAGREGG